MDAADVCVISSRDDGGGLVVRIGIPLADVYLDFLGGRCRPNTVLAAAYDLKVFFAVVARPPDQVRPAEGACSKCRKIPGVQVPRFCRRSGRCAAGCVS
jgi:hypothetical protein